MNLLPPQILPPLRLDMWHTHEEGVTAFAHADGQTVNEHATRACKHSSLVFLLGEETAAAAPRLTVMLRRSTAWPCRESYWMALHTTKNTRSNTILPSYRLLSAAWISGNQSEWREELEARAAAGKAGQAWKWNTSLQCCFCS